MLCVEELAARDLPLPERQVACCRGRPRRAFKIDFAWPQFMVAIEVDGGNWIRGSHTRASRIIVRRRDRRPIISGVL